MIRSLRRPRSADELQAAIRLLALDAWGVFGEPADGFEDDSVLELQLAPDVRLSVEVLPASVREAERLRAESARDDDDAPDDDEDHEPGPGTFPPGSRLSLN